MTIGCRIQDCSRPVALKREQLCNAHNLRRRRHGDPLGGGAFMVGGTLSDRLWAKIHVIGEDDCWPWTGSLDGTGYGQIYVGGNVRLRGAHIVAYELSGGVIPPGLDLDHLCHNADMSCPGGSTCLHRRCCNPRHLQPATREENATRGVKGRPDQRTHCANGHVFDEANTYVEPPHGYRKCRLCRNAAMDRFLEKRARV